MSGTISVNGDVEAAGKIQVQALNGYGLIDVAGKHAGIIKIEQISSQTA